jgi:hypothetical protein
MLKTLGSFLSKLRRNRPGFRENPELEPLVREIALLRRRAAGFDPEVGKVSQEEYIRLLAKIKEMMFPRLDDLTAYLAPYLEQPHKTMDWYGEPTPEWCRQFVAGEIPWLRRM